ncbi:Gamma-glutamyltranspeptidase 1 [Choanephora cucurbitarum]|uniref:Glutathione hydrolase n=1 Tax=Choanephora cucurbitarum TaxID=101091 RepID=A0A1C7NR15_9FUNG|nr:Gamma-glutamyltranspeptidase 1 [Choanephora cucurbitarum]
MTDVESIPLIRDKHTGPNRKKVLLGGILLLLGTQLIPMNMLFSRKDVSLESPVAFKGHLVKGLKGGVAVEVQQCSEVGVQVLKDGGNAVDSAIAANLCIGVINNFATGFMLIRSPNGTFEYIDFRETAPAAATKDMFVDDPLLAKTGGLSIGVPYVALNNLVDIVSNDSKSLIFICLFSGEVRGLELAHRRHGKLPWEDLFQPAIKIAREGFKTPKLLEIRVKKEQGWIQNLTEWSEVYMPEGKPVKEGDIVRRPTLANTLETIAKEGADAFYRGKIAKSLIKTIQSNGGIMTLDDLQSYRPMIRPTIHTYYNGRKVTTCSEPTSGTVLLSVLNLIERFQFKVEGLTGLNIHRLVEAFKFGYAFRTEMGDPDFIDNNERMQQLTNKDFAADIRQKITDDTTHDPLYYNPKFDHIESHGTMHLSVVDENDGAVALTSTVNLAFGSHVMDPDTGIILNDEMDDFSIPGVPNQFGLYPSEDNYAGPGKRPLSSITPTIVEMDTKFEMVLGGSGGSFIPTATLNALINVLDFGKDMYRAVASPRIHHQLLPNTAITENGYSHKIEKELEAKNHQVFQIPSELSFSAVQGVRRLPDGTIEAASDPRKMGIAAAY